MNKMNKKSNPGKQPRAASVVQEEISDLELLLARLPNSALGRSYIKPYSARLSELRSELAKSILLWSEKSE